MKQILLYMYINLLMLLLVMINVMVAVAFLTLMERKLLSYIQIRKGPNKVGFLGLMQPFSDAIKLLVKENNFMGKINFMFYIIGPVYMLVLILMMWMIYPIWIYYNKFSLIFLYLMCCFSLGVYGLMITGWSSNSSYSLLGSIRSLAQSISYEVVLALMMIMPLMLIDSLNLFNLLIFQVKGVWFIILMWPLSMVFLFSLMAELNRTPFDFSEGESELVSGFNIEYGSSGFVLIFLSEYASIMFLSMLFNIFFLGGESMGLLFMFKVIFLSFLIIWVRGTLPRFRYDLLMYLCWLIILPFSLNYMFYLILMKISLFK